jgi:DNA-binding response OmpR family regulator
MKNTVLAVDDDVHILQLLKRFLEPQGFEVIVAINGEEALTKFNEFKPDLVLLDITMTGMDGYTVCRRIREFSGTPIIMITAKSSEEEIVRGLETGADDYVIKPFSLKELTARIQAALRHKQRGQTNDQPAFEAGNLIINFNTARVILDGKEIELTATEYQIITYLALNAGRVLTPDQILTRVWDESYQGENHLLQVNIARIRKKLETDKDNPKYLITHPGIGYRLAKSPLP